LFVLILKLLQEGFFQHYDSWTWATIGLQTCGGLLSAAAIK
jgi:hypothetical protein